MCAVESFSLLFAEAFYPEKQIPNYKPTPTIRDARTQPNPNHFAMERAKNNNKN